jgi:hypothetical protein
MKRYSIIIFVAFLLWWVVQILFLKIVNDLAISHSNMLYIIIYNIVMCSIFGFLIGWFSKEKGWLLGFVFSIMIISIPIITVFTADFFKADLMKIGYWNVIKSIMLSNPTAITFICLIGCGFLGNVLRKKIKNSAQ